MTAARLLETIRELGGRIAIVGDSLRIGPRCAVAELESEFRDHADELATLIGREHVEAVAWRAKIMAEQIPPDGPIPVLAAREGAWLAGHGVCTSCGDRFEVESGGSFGRTLRCRACREAAEAAIRWAR